MKQLIIILNALNYIVIALLIIFNFNNLSEKGLDICRYFLFISCVLFIFSLIMYLITKKEFVLKSSFINLINLIAIFPILLLIMI